MLRFSLSYALSRTAFVMFGLLISIAVQAGTFTNATTALTAPATSTGSHTVSFKTAAWGTFYLQEKKNSGNWVNVHTFAIPSVNDLTYTRNVARSGLTSGTYSYRVYFVPGLNSSLSASYSNTKVTVISLVPGIPSSISTPINDNDGAFTVSWGVASGVIESYQLEQQANDGTNTWTQIYSGTGTSQAVTGLVDSTYSYRVKACNSEGCSGYQLSSNSTIVAHTPGVPPNATLTTGETF